MCDVRRTVNISVLVFILALLVIVMIVPHFQPLGEETLRISGGNYVASGCEDMNITVKLRKW